MKRNTFVSNTCKICNESVEHIRYHVFHKHGINFRQYFDKYTKNSENSTCKNCKKQTKWSLGYMEYRTFCCNKCRAEYAVKTGVAHLSGIKGRTKFKQTMLTKYGVIAPMQMKEVREKSKETCLRKYGVTSVSKVGFIMDRARGTCLRKYGGRSSSCSTLVREKAKRLYWLDMV